jgi:hypothetical protein
VSAYIRNGDLKDAIKLVDQGLATALQQSMQLKTRPGECLRAEEEREMKSLSRQICDRRASLGDRRKALKQMKELIKRIRGQDDLDRFLLPRNYEQLSEAAKNGPVVILNSDGTHCDALILLRAREEPLHLELTNICEDLKNIQNKGLTHKSSVPPATRFPCTPERIPSKELPALLELLKQHITVPIQAELKKVGVPAWIYPASSDNLLAERIPRRDPIVVVSDWHIHWTATTCCNRFNPLHPFLHFDTGGQPSAPKSAELENRYYWSPPNRRPEEARKR